MSTWRSPAVRFSLPATSASTESFHIPAASSRTTRGLTQRVSDCACVECLPSPCTGAAVRGRRQDARRSRCTRPGLAPGGRRKAMSQRFRTSLDANRSNLVSRIGPVDRRVVSTILSFTRAEMSTVSDSAHRSHVAIHCCEWAPVSRPQIMDVCWLLRLRGRRAGSLAESVTRGLANHGAATQHQPGVPEPAEATRPWCSEAHDWLTPRHWTSRASPY